MSKIKDVDIATLLERWSQDKAEITEIEKRIDKYKKIAERIMNSQDTNTISSGPYTLKRSNMSRSTLTKQDVPESVWKQYSRTCSYPAYYLSKK